MLAQRLEAAQSALIAALDAQDAPAIQAAVATLTPLVAQLQSGNTLYASADAKEQYEHLRNMTDAAMYRINILHDQTRRRLEMLHDQRGKTAKTYGRPTVRVIEA
jgi:hypothetical protein